MVFSSAIFVFIFLPFFLLAYELAGIWKDNSIRNFVLFIASLIFYAWGGVQYLLLLLFLIVLNYFWGIKIEKAMIENNTIKKRRVLIIGIGIDLFVLLIFKYFNFFVSVFESIICQVIGKPFSFNAPVIPLPIGISFFMFQIMSYLIDVYRNSVKAQRSVLKLGVYIMMFPQLIAGPIVRYSQIEQEIDNRKVSISMRSEGIERFIIGFAKKVLLANTVGIFADAAFGMETINFLYAWLGILCYALQIYFDFSAYSDMAIGLGLIMGFHFEENFNYPYISKSVQEFWRRWHISLSTWFRDYVYIPLGGSRCGTFKTYRNLLIVFFLTGFWHGAAWQFIVWGLYYGIFLVLERLGWKNILEKLPKALQWLYTMSVVLIGWVFFRADNLTKAIQYIKCMFQISTDGLGAYEMLRHFDISFIFFTIIACFCCCPIYSKISEKCKKWAIYQGIKTVTVFLLFIVAITYMVSSSFNPFIYFKF